MGHKAKEITREEARYLFLKHMVSMVDYWENESRATTSKEKLEGLLFSILAALDGSSAEIPGYILIPSTHDSDKEYAIKQGYDYYPHCEELPKGVYDIGGTLHEHLHEHLVKKVKRPDNLYDFGKRMSDEVRAKYPHMFKDKQE